MCSVALALDNLALALRNLAEPHVRAGQFAEAEPLLLESLKMFTANHGEQHGMTKNVIQALITLYERWGKHDQAAEWRAKLPTTQPAQPLPNP